MNKMAMDVEMGDLIRFDNDGILSVKRVSTEYNARGLQETTIIGPLNLMMKMDPGKIVHVYS